MTTFSNKYETLNVILYGPTGLPVGPTQNTSNLVSVAVGNDDTKVKNNLANFASYRAEHPVLPVLPYERFISWGSDLLEIGGVIDKASGNTGNYWKGTAHTVRFKTPPTKDALLAMYASQKDASIQLARARLSEHIQNIEWDLMVDVAEAKKSADLFTSNIKQAQKFVSLFNLRNGKFYRLARNQLNGMRNRARQTGGTNAQQRVRLRGLFNALNDKYLEFTYGWVPLAHSIHDAATLLENRMTPHTNRAKFSGHDFFEARSSTRTDSEFILGSFAKASYNVIFDYRYDVWFGGVVPSPASRSLADSLGVNLSNVPATLWELTHFSFIVDYFTNVGDFINNLKLSTMRLDSTSLYMSEKITYSGHFQVLKIVDANPATHKVVTNIISNDTLSMRYFRRQAINVSDTLVRLRWTSPSARQLLNTLSVGLSVSKLLR